jgi:hypothetical protein
MNTVLTAAFPPISTQTPILPPEQVRRRPRLAVTLPEKEIDGIIKGCFIFSAAQKQKKFFLHLKDHTMGALGISAHRKCSLLDC